MPHIHLEYSENLKNLEAKPVLAALNQALFATGHVSSALDIKSRAVCHRDYVIGLEADDCQAYVHVKLSLLTGRSVETQQQISNILLDTLQQQIVRPEGIALQLCVEVLEMNSATYSKKAMQA